MCEVALGRVGIQQRVLPDYRVPFFDMLAAACPRGLSVFAGQPRPEEAVVSAAGLHVARYAAARNRHFLSPRSPFYFCWQENLLDWLEDWQPEALIVEANPRYRSTPAAVRWMHARRRPVIGWGLGAPAARGPLGRWRARAWPPFLRQFDALIAYSPRGAEEYRAYGFPAERVFVAPNAVAPRPTAPPPPRSCDSSAAATVLFVGRLQARKRVDVLLRACASLPPELQPRLIVVGDGPERETLQRLAQAVYRCAEFPGAHTGSRLEPYFAAADVFVLPGTGGLAVQQAMAHALPVIVGRGDGTQDYLVRPENGWRIPDGDLPALVETLRTALSDKPRLRRMGEASYRIVAEEINLENMVSVFLQALMACSPCS